MENTKKTERIGGDIRVLLLDSDATSLLNLSNILYECGYSVVAMRRADDLPLIINNKGEKIDLVLAEFSLIEMNKYELLQKIRSICEIPIVVVGGYVENDIIIDCLSRGVKFYLKKPLREGILGILWQLTVSRQQDFLIQFDTNPPKEMYSMTHTLPLGDELNNKNSEIKTEDLDEYEGANVESGVQKKPELILSEMHNEFRETDDKLSQGSKRKERVDAITGEHTKRDYGSDLEDQKKPKIMCADDLHTETLEGIPNIGKANNERNEPTKMKKNEEESDNSEFEIKAKLELVCMVEELEKFATQLVTNFGPYVPREFKAEDFLPLERAAECADHHAIILSSRESSNKNVASRTYKALDEELMQDGISLSDLEYDLQEGHGSTSDLDKKATQGLFDEIYTDFANELKP